MNLQCENSNRNRKMSEYPTGKKTENFATIAFVMSLVIYSLVKVLI
jgi:hypothetical protein